MEHARLSPNLLQESPVVEELLRPLPGERPTGSYLLYEGTYDRIREARRFDNPDLPRDIWEHDLKSADWAQVENLCRDALTFRSKDLQIAAWWLEAALHTRGFQGLAEGIELLYYLCERYWDDLYPELSEDLDYRIAPFHWLNEKFSPQLMSVPLAAHDDGRIKGVTWGHWKQAVWLEVLKSRNPNDADVKRQVERALSKDDILRALKAAPPGALLAQLTAIDAGLEGVRALEYLLDERLTAQSPSLVRLREHLTEVHGGLTTILKTLPGGMPEPKLDEPLSDIILPHLPAGSGDAPESTAMQHDSAQPPIPSTGAFTGREAAYRSIEATARYLRSIEPHSPAPYMILRAVAWGEKSLSELIVELRRNGLDLESLSSLLGLNEEGDM
jgi:type VI secretion system protein ImpA